jgi:glucans biosynthesis protein
LAAGSEHRFDYHLDWTLSAPPDQGAGMRILQSRSGLEHDRPGIRRYVIDLAGAANGLTPDISTADAVQISGIGVFALPENRGTRVTFLMSPQGAVAAELRMVLRDVSGLAVGPVWLHRWTPTRDGGV